MYSIELMRTCCSAQGTLRSAPWWSKREGNPKKRGYMYSWFTLLYLLNISLKYHFRISWSLCKRFYGHHMDITFRPCFPRSASNFIFVYSLIFFPGGSDSKESTCNMGDISSIPGLERSPGGAYGNPLQYSCLENPHGHRSLAGYSPWGRKESDTTEWLSTAQPIPYF